MPTPPDDILLSKAAVIERCIRRMHEEFAACPALDNFSHLDALTLNIERACQAAIDMAMHVVATRHLGVPQSNAEAFTLLERAGLIDADLCKSLRGMVGFRNIAVHQYEEMDLNVLRWVVQSGQRLRFPRHLYTRSSIAGTSPGLRTDTLPLRSSPR